MKKSKNRVRYTEKDTNKRYCFRCGSYNVEVTSDNIILCKNLSCLCVSKFDIENNELSLKFKVKDNSKGGIK